MTLPTFLADTLLADRYRPVRLIAQGGMGQVLEAVDERLHRPVAVKLVNTTAPDEAARLRGEALALARLHHPNIVGVYDTGEHDGRPFIVTELVQGESLRELIDREGPLPIERVAAIGADVARALECAHGHGIVHRDLKPANILVEEGSGRARLIDFGVAMSEHAVALTHTGLVIGTPAYLSPEQVDGTRAGPASDIYSLGLVLLEAVTGRVPFPGTTAETVAARLARSPEVPEELGPRWSWLLGAMTRRDPSHRPATPSLAALLAAMADALRPRVEPAFPDLDDDLAPETTRVVPAVGATTAVAPLAAAAAASAAAAEEPTTALSGGSGPEAPPWPAAAPSGAAASSGARWDVDRRRLVGPLATAAIVVLALVLAAGMALAGRSDQSPAVADPTTTAVASTETTPTTPPPTTAPPTTEAPVLVTEPPATTAPAPAPKAKGDKGGGPGAKKDDPKHSKDG